VPEARQGLFCTGSKETSLADQLALAVGVIEEILRRPLKSTLPLLLLQDLHVHRRMSNIRAGTLAFTREHFMAPTPVAIGLAICDYVIREAKTHKITLVGCFDKLRCPSFPSAPHPLSVFAALTGGLGHVKIDLVISRMDTGEEIALYSNPANFPEKLTVVNYHLRLNHLSFPEATVYEFVLFADGQWLAQRRLEVEKTEE